MTKAECPQVIVIWYKYTRVAFMQPKYNVMMNIETFLKIAKKIKVIKEKTMLTATILEKFAKEVNRIMYRAYNAGCCYNTEMSKALPGRVIIKKHDDTEIDYIRNDLQVF